MSGRAGVRMKWVMMFLVLGLVGMVSGACDCGSTDKNAPCTGTTITVIVDAGTPNGGVAVDSVYVWEFNSGGKDAYCGKFANGDYWVAPADGETEVTITSISTTSPGGISADTDPIMESMGLLDGSKNYGNYNFSENIIPDLPVSYSGINSIVAAIQRNESVEGGCGTKAILGGCVDSYDVLTVLSSVPEDCGIETIRPNIVGENKELLTFDDFDFSRLPSLDFLSGTDEEGLENIRRRWSHSTEVFGLINSEEGVYSEGGRAFRSHILIDDYGGGVASQINSNLMNLFSDDNTLEEKKSALAAMISYGLDIYHSIYDSPDGVIRYYGVGATQSPGKFTLPVFMAALSVRTSDDEDLKVAGDILKNASGWGNRYMGPLELAQIRPGVDGRPLWGDEAWSTYSDVQMQGAYWGSLWKSQCYDGATGTCNVAIGKKTQADPYGYVDGPPNKPGSNYMASSLGVMRSFLAVAFIMPEFMEIVNYPDVVTYVDNLEHYGLQTLNDPCVTPDSREDLDGDCDPYRNRNCVYYGVTWGPVDVTDYKKGCITNVTLGYTKVGRFTELDGNTVNPSYTAWQVESNWDVIRAMYEGVSYDCNDSVDNDGDIWSMNSSAGNESKVSGCFSGADLDLDDEVSVNELVGFFEKWLSGEVEFDEVVAGMNEWRGGC